MTNLRHPNTGKELVKQVLHQTGSTSSHVIKQAKAPTANNTNKPKLPSKFSAHKK